MNYLNLEICPSCGNVIEKINGNHHPLMCCGTRLEELSYNSTEAAVEKHLPLISLEKDILTVAVAEVMHPTLASHYIPWVIIQTPTYVIRQTFEPGELPVIKLPRPEKGTLVRAYAYCNLHGLWVSERVI